MNILDTLVTDRTMADAERLLEMNRKGWAHMTAEERAEYRAGPKGGYCAIDMNRVTGAMEYLDGLMFQAGASSGYKPLEIMHVTAGADPWTDATWIAEDKPRPAQWVQYLDNVRQFWAYVRRIEADVLPRYDPHGTFFVPLDETFSAGNVCTVTACNGLLRLAVDVECDPGTVAAGGTGWETEPTGGGLRASFFYPGWMFEDVQMALDALRFQCTEKDGTFEVSITFRAELRYGAEVELGTCGLRWSSRITWGGASAAWPTWESTDGLTWYGMERGEGL